MPSPEFTAKAHVDAAKYEDMYAASVNDPEAFWGEHGLRFHEPYAWSNTIHSSFHEMAYILSALNRWRLREPDNRVVRRRMAELVRGWARRWPMS